VKNPIVHLKPGKEKQVLRGHPWIFSGAIGRVQGAPAAGDTVEVFDHRQQWLARGAWSPKSQISVRVWTRHPDELVDAAFFRDRLSRALRHRNGLYPEGSAGAVRLVFAESDQLPGLVVDRFNNLVVAQFSATGVERWKETIIDELVNITGCEALYERSDLQVRAREGLAESSGIRRGRLTDQSIVIVENGIQFKIDVDTVHKTGFYLDQRENRRLVRLESAGASVLDCFSFNGGFAVSALYGGAERVTLVDSSAPALEGARNNVVLNGFDSGRAVFDQGDAFSMLRKYNDEKRLFDVVVLDPPKLIENSAQVMKGARAYKNLNRVAMKLVKPGGWLFTFSCSGHMEDALFQKVVADAAVDAQREALIAGWLAQAPDHPVHMQFPEGKYLKGLKLRVL